MSAESPPGDQHFNANTANYDWEENLWNNRATSCLSVVYKVHLTFRPISRNRGESTNGEKVYHFLTVKQLPSATSGIGKKFNCSIITYKERHISKLLYRTFSFQIKSPSSLPKQCFNLGRYTYWQMLDCSNDYFQFFYIHRLKFDYVNSTPRN